jgi:hypothetical protein
MRTWIAIMNCSSVRDHAPRLFLPLKGKSLSQTRMTIARKISLC